MAQKSTPQRVNLFLLTKLPSAFLCGVRVKSINRNSCQTTVKYRWINQNPFKSMYFAVQAMAAELSTGALLFNEVSQQDLKISMLVVATSAQFHKKAKGRIIFTCNDADQMREAVHNAIKLNQPQLIWLKSTAHNEQNEVVSEMQFQWSIKRK